jgi:hypothetical protein
MSSEEKDRRLSPRVAGGELEIQYLAPIPHIRDLSLSGFYIIDPRLFQRGQTVEFRISLGDAKPIVATGMVRRVEPGKGMAVEFIRIDADARRRIKEFIAGPGKV